MNMMKCYDLIHRQQIRSITMEKEDGIQLVENIIRSFGCIHSKCLIGVSMRCRRYLGGLIININNYIGQTHTHT